MPGDVRCDQLSLQHEIVMSNASPQPQVPLKAGPAAARSFGRAANWTVGIATILVLLISGGGYFYHRQWLWGVAAEHLRLFMSGPSVLQVGVAAEYLVNTTTINGQPLAAQVEVLLSGPEGKRLKAYREPTDERGRLRVVIPADLSLPPVTRLKVAAWHRESREQAEMPLRVEPTRYATRLVSDQPAYRPGETMHYRSLTLSRFGLAADRELPVHYEILDPSGVVVCGSPLDAVTRRGVGSGVFSFPHDSPEGQYRLAVRGPDRIFPPQTEPVVFRRQPATPPKKGAVERGKVEVTFFPEGGNLVAGLENRVYFAARNSRNEPIPLSGMIVATEHGDAGRDEEVALVQTAFDGMGVFSFALRTDESYRLKITGPKGVTDKPKLPQVAADRDLVLTTGAGVFAAEKPLEFNIRATKAGLPLVVAVYCRGVQVGQQPLLSRAGANPVAIPLDSAVGGVLRLTVYNYRLSPPQVAAERLVYRRPAQKLNVAVTGLHKQYAPGQKVELSLSVTNEKGQPAPAALDVAVADNALASAAENRVASLPTYFLLTGEIEQPANLEDADFYLSDRTEDYVSAAAALDLLLGMQTARSADSATTEPPLLFDNLSQIRSHYEEDVAEYRGGQTDLLSTITIAGLFSGLGLILLLAMLGLMRIVSGLHLWIPALSVITSCLLLARILLDLSRLATGPETAVAFSSYHAAIPNVGNAESPLRPQAARPHGPMARPIGRPSGAMFTNTPPASRAATWPRFCSGIRC